jgi:large subunit ribosomal protein L38e
MPKELKDVRQFLQKARGDNKIKPSAKSVQIKTVGQVTKFKLRCSKYLYTLVVDEPNKAEKVQQSLPPSLPKKEIK